jgi:Tat protein translocase TatB subunit
MNNIGGTELLLILVVALIVLGPRRLPEIGESVGRALRRFRRASRDIREEIDIMRDFDDDPPRRSRQGSATDVPGRAHQHQSQDGREEARSERQQDSTKP